MTRRVVFSLIPATVALVAVLSLSEVLLRHHFGKIERITGVAEWSTATFGALNYYWDTYHPLYGWTNLPGYRSDSRVPFSVTINSQGLRASREYALSPEAGTHRIAVLGDSCTFGEDVDDDQTLPYYLERHLQATDVLNFGVHGYGLGEMVLRMENEVFSYHPDVVVLVITSPSDFGRTILTDFVHPKPAFTIEAGNLTVVNSPVPSRARQPFVLRHSFVAAWLFARVPQPELQDEQVPEVSRALLERAKADCDKWGVPLAIVAIAGPDWVRTMDEASYRQLVEATREVTGVGVPVSDQIGYLGQMIQREPDVVAQTNAHWSGRGNCLLAGNVATGLTRMYSWLSRSPEPPPCTRATIAAPARPTPGS
jgi:hypothetical protein